MTLLSKAELESQKHGSKRGRSESLYLQDSRAEGLSGRGGLRVGGQQEMHVTSWFLPGNLKLVFNKQGRVLMKTLVLRDKINQKSHNL